MLKLIMMKILKYLVKTGVTGISFIIRLLFIFKRVGFYGACKKLNLVVEIRPANRKNWIAVLKEKVFLFIMLKGKNVMAIKSTLGAVEQTDQIGRGPP